MTAARSSKYRWQRRLVPAVWRVGWRLGRVRSQMRRGLGATKPSHFVPILLMPIKTAKYANTLTRWRVFDVVQIVTFPNTVVSKYPKN